MKILILSPHPDDCEACMGGTIAKLVREGHDVKVIFFSDCDVYHISGEVNRSMEVLGVKKHYLLSYRRRIMDFHRQEILQILCDEKNVERVYCPSPHDSHQDHAVIANEAIRAFSSKADVIFYLWHKNLNNVQPSMFSELTEEDMQLKIEALKKYKSQIKLRPSYFTEDVFRSMATFYGVMAGCKYAEAFQPYRIRHEIRITS